MSINSDISVVIPARESHKTICKTIDSLLAQSLKPREIIVLTTKGDSTKKYLKKYITKGIVKHLEISLNNEYIRDAQIKRWTGAKSAKSKYIFFTDSKVLLNKEALELSLKFSLKYKVEAVAGSAESWQEDDNLFISKIQDKGLIKNNPRFPKAKKLTLRNFGKTESLPLNTAFMMTKNAFNKIADDYGLEYSKRSSSYDDYVVAWLLVKNGVDILLTNQIIAYHKHRTKWNEYFKQISRSGQAAALMLEYYPDCPFGKRRLLQVMLLTILVSCALIVSLLIFAFLGLHAFEMELFLIIMLFMLLGAINAIIEKDTYTVFIPPLTLVLILIFSFHFLKWYILSKRSYKLSIDSYLQIN